MSDPLLDALLEAVARREPVALVTIIEATGPLRGRRALVWQDATRLPLADAAEPPLPLADLAGAARAALARGLSTTTDLGDLRLFVEVQSPPAALIICGAGHVAVPLAAMAALCDFDVTVLDDRALYATPARFPAARQVIAGDFRQELRALRAQAGFGARTALVLVTRGHQHDVDCLLEVLDDPLGYVGMIGSRRRIRAVFELLEREQGIDPARLARVHAPIGLDIGARTPAEIAVAILAEIVNVQRSGRAPGLSDALRATRGRTVHRG